MMPTLRWCPDCRRAAEPDTVTADIVGWPDVLLRRHVDEVCGRCDRVLHERVSGPDALRWADAQWAASGRLTLGATGELRQGAA